MADLCVAFKRIVPRYQSTINRAMYSIEDMRDAPKKKRNGGDCFRGKGGNNYHSTPIEHAIFDNYVQRCRPMDTCRNWQSKMRY